VSAPRTAGARSLAERIAGTSIGNVFVFPTNMLSRYVLAIVASYRTIQDLRSRLPLLLSVAGISGAVTGIASYFIGMLIVRTQYPDLASEVNAFYHWIAVGNAFWCGTVLLKPVVVRFARPKFFITVSLLGLCIQVAFVVLLIPRYGAWGAATGWSIGTVASGCLWIAAAVFLRAPR
jgi:O-antigen/teichoic acid export membrane protein